MISKVFIIGATGYIGKKFLETARELVTIPVYGTTTSGSGSLIQLRFDDLKAFDFNLFDDGCVTFVLAAISAPDICALEHDRASAVNVEGTAKFIAQVIQRGGRVVFFSSDTVYGARADEFDEKAACNPSGEYAVMKREVEQRFLGNASFKSIRLSYVFSREDKFSRYLAGCVERNEEAELFHPFYRAVVHRDDVIKGALALAKHWDETPEQFVNFGGPEVLSRVEFAKCLQKIFLQHLKFKVTEPDDTFFENRPRIIAMKSPVFTRLLGRTPSSLFEAARIEFAT